MLIRAGRAPVLFVSAGLLQPKKRDHALARRQLYLNYGALGLASLCQRNGLQTLLVHGEHEAPDALAARLHKQGLLRADAPLMLSMTSFYALEWAQLFCRAVKELAPRVRIVLGGRWVTGPDSAWLQGKLPQVDRIVQGLGEDLLPSLLAFEGRWDGRVCGLNHLLVEGHRRYQPSIETSRGCGKGCVFCEERDVPLQKLKAPELIVDELRQLADDYGDHGIHPYFQSSFFLPNPRWAQTLAEQVQRCDTRILWRCESRVDGIKPDTVKSLAAAGMKVIDLGLESAAPRQILAMNKARDPARYLESASKLLQACASHGIWVKVNVLLYAGETAATLEQTRQWLDEHAQCIKGVSVGPVVVYGPPRHSAGFLAQLQAQGATPVDPASAEYCGITQLNLSPELDAAQVERESLAMSRRYMQKQDYLDLKRFSYYPRDYSEQAFEADVAASDAACLPFRP
ncbi:B12-binding domain-containing radical SAM protein [Pseudomonas sp. NY15354]|uniref:B12-binding domain-containing radical SAM protein n=1 Tax=Pseudomonas sp. NY15354 TaxID=3400351 RepID=UPI003A840FB0